MINKYGPWIGWNGGECPVDGSSIVQVTTSSGQIMAQKAGDFTWSLGSHGPKIIVYRVKIEPKVYQWTSEKTALLFNDGTVMFEAKGHKPRNMIVREVEIKITATQTGGADPVFEIERVG